MDAFSLEPPEWSQTAVHAREFGCPHCREGAADIAQAVWINRRSPVYTPDQRRKWQEFYHCTCGQAWWAWSSDRPLSELSQRYQQED
ncbi:MAG: hypothetical protein VKJ64_14060 [Leptolyngbyaceae bacterium]|nr:hypothetical protein [Leptolyngbyaceae bacterium]